MTSGGKRGHNPIQRRQLSTNISPNVEIQPTLKRRATVLFSAADLSVRAVDDVMESRYTGTWFGHCVSASCARLDVQIFGSASDMRGWAIAEHDADSTIDRFVS